MRVRPFVFSDGPVDGELHGDPRGHVRGQEPVDPDAVHEQGVQPDEVERYGQDGGQHGAHPHAGAQQLVVQVALVGQEGVPARLQPAEHDADDVEQGDDERGEGQHHARVASSARFRRGAAQVDGQQAEDVAQRQAPGVAHEELVAALRVAEDVVEPEGDYHAERGEGQQGEGVAAGHGVHGAQYGQGDAAQARGQPVDAVDQVDGVGDEHDDEDRERHARPGRQGVEAGQPAHGVEPLARQDHQHGGEHLHGELVAVAHAHQVVGHAHQEEQHGPHREEEELAEGAARHAARGGGQEEVRPEGEPHRDEDDGEEGQPAQARHGDGVHLPAVGHVEEAFLVGDEQDVGDDQGAEQGGGQETSHEVQAGHCRSSFLVRVVFSAIGMSYIYYKCVRLRG